MKLHHKLCVFVSSTIGVGNVIQSVDSLYSISIYVTTVRVISDLTGRLQVDEIMTHAAVSY